MPISIPYQCMYFICVWMGDLATRFLYIYIYIFICTYIFLNGKTHIYIYIYLLYIIYLLFIYVHLFLNIFMYMYCIQICRLPSLWACSLLLLKASPFGGFSTLMEFNGILLFWVQQQLKDVWIFRSKLTVAYFSLGLVFRYSLLVETSVAIYSTDPELMAPFSSRCPMQLSPLRPSFASCAAHGATLERDCKFSRRREGHLNGMVASVLVWFSRLFWLYCMYFWITYTSTYAFSWYLEN